MSQNTSVSSLNAEGEFLMLFKNFTSLRFIWGDVHQCIIYLVETGTSGLSFCSDFDSGEDQERLLTEFSPLIYFSITHTQLAFRTFLSSIKVEADDKMTYDEKLLLDG